MRKWKFRLPPVQTDMKDESRAKKDLRLGVAAALATGILLAGLAVRVALAYASLRHIDHDQASSLLRSQFPQVRRLDFDPTPPLHILTLWSWNKLFGVGVLQGRLLSALFSVLAIGVLYFMVSYLFDRRVALLSMLLLAMSRDSIFYGEIIRPYAMLQFFALLSSYLFFRSLREKRLVWWVAFVGSGILMMYTHYYGALVIAALAVCALIYRSRYQIPGYWIAGAAAGAAAVALISYLPMAGISIGGPADIRRHLTETANLWYVKAHWYTFFTTLGDFNNEISPGRWWAFAAGAALFSVPAILALKKAFIRGRNNGFGQRPDDEGIWISAILWLFPFLAALGASALGAHYFLRYVLFCAAPYYILVAYGISMLEHNALRNGLIMLIVAFSAYSIANMFSLGTDGPIVARLDSDATTGDCAAMLWVVTAPPSWLALWDASSSGPLASIPIAKPDRFSLRLIPQTTLPGAFAPCHRIWVLKVPDEALGPPAEQIKHLDEEALRFLRPSYSRAAEYSYGDVRLGLYSRNGN